jgi:hypothetical protein
VNPIVGLAIAFGVMFGGIGAVMAGLVTYNEYRKHRLTRWLLWSETTLSALVTFLVIAGLGALAGLVISRFVR